jgi:hypothetical protein
MTGGASCPQKISSSTSKQYRYISELYFWRLFLPTWMRIKPIKINGDPDPDPQQWLKPKINNKLRYLRLIQTEEELCRVTSSPSQLFYILKFKKAAEGYGF